MTNYNEAKLIVLQELEKMENAQYPDDKFTLQLMEEETIEKDFGWVFFYNSKEFLEDHNLSYQLAGNSPIIVDRQDGSVHKTGTAHSIDYYIREYENIRNPKQEELK
jgi:Immunity protein 35